MGICFSLAFMIGPMIGAYFAGLARQLGHISPGSAYFAMILTVIEILMLFFLLPETKSKEVSTVLQLTTFYLE